MKASEQLRGPGLGLGAGALPAFAELARAVARVTTRWPDVVVVPEIGSRDGLAREMLQRVTHWNWAGVPTHRVTAAAFAAFDQDRRDNAVFAPLRNFYLREIESSDQQPFLAAMFRVYIESFAPGAPHTIGLAAALRRKLHALGPTADAILHRLPDLLRPEHAADAMAALMANADDPYAALKAAGFATPHVPGLPHYAHLAFIARIAPRLDQRSEQERLLRWLKPGQAAPLQAGASDAVAALLTPWRDRTPHEDRQHRLTEAIVASYGDPRIIAGGIWAGFPQPLKAVLLRWLTKADMRLFCDVITETQNDPQWPPRRDYWLGLFEDRRIDEAWVAFGSSAEKFARQHFSGNAAISPNRQFARQLDRGGSTSLLIMRIGNKIVVDGCHDYKTHIFNAHQTDAPRLYGWSYHCDAIMRQSQLARAHRPIRNWQVWVEQHI